MIDHLLFVAFIAFCMLLLWAIDKLPKDIAEVIKLAIIVGGLILMTIK
jgi:hypothetical protein